jgi:preprotein translocase subunit SecG
MNIILSLVMLALLIICGLMGIIILMQKPSANAGMGAALGGGAAESVFGGEAGNMLLKYTIRFSVAFFLVSFLLYLAMLAHHRAAVNNGVNLDILHNSALTGASSAAANSTTTTTTAGNPAISGKMPATTGAANATSTSTLPATPAASTAAGSGPAALPTLAPLTTTPAPAAASASASN